MNVDSIISQLKEEQERLARVIEMLTEFAGNRVEPRVQSVKRTMSPEARERIANAQRERWRKARKAKV